MNDRRAILRGLASLPALLVSSACGSESLGAQTATRKGQPLRRVAGCEGCEAVWEREPRTLQPMLRLAGPGEPGQRLTLSGTIYRPDGRTPASDIVVYVHHTNAAGRYADGSSESEWSRRHGRLRGWLRTGEAGRYEVRTIKPGPYPGRTDPAHIHLFVLEPGRADPYWIDDVVFSGEFGVNDSYREERTNQGGSGIVRLVRNADGSAAATRDITLLG